MTYRDFIASDHTIMLGKPVIKGTRLAVELILRKLGEGATHSSTFREIRRALSSPKTKISANGYLLTTFQASA